MGLRILFLAMAMALLAIPAAQAQSGREREGRARVELPQPGRATVIGVRLSDVTAEDVKTLKLPKQEGAIVQSVRPNSPAATAGFREKDVIVQFDGERVRSAGHLSRLVAETPVGRAVAVAVVRDGRRMELRVTPEVGSWFDPRFGAMFDLNSEEWREQIERAGRAARELGRSFPEAMAPGRARLGVTVQELDGQLADYFGVKSGILVSNVAPESGAARAGVKAGDVITAVNGASIGTPRELVNALPTGDSPSEVTLTIVRAKKELTLKATLTGASHEGARQNGARL